MGRMKMNTEKYGSRDTVPATDLSMVHHVEKLYITIICLIRAPGCSSKVISNNLGTKLTFLALIPMLAGFRLKIGQLLKKL